MFVISGFLGMPHNKFNPNYAVSGVSDLIENAGHGKFCSEYACQKSRALLQHFKRLSKAHTKCSQGLNAGGVRRCLRASRGPWWWRRRRQPSQWWDKRWSRTRHRFWADAFSLEPGSDLDLDNCLQVVQAEMIFVFVHVNKYKKVMVSSSMVWALLSLFFSTPSI